MSDSLFFCLFNYQAGLTGCYSGLCVVVFSGLFFFGSLASPGISSG
jgi:hypothetical protein